MRLQIYWIEGPWPGRLAVFPRPRGGDWLRDEVASWERAGLNDVVSSLVPEEAAEFDLGREQKYCAAHGIEFHSLPIPDREVPASAEQVSDLVHLLDERLSAGKNVGIHCRQGIGRSGLIAGCLFVSAGVTAADAMNQLSHARGCTVPETAQQRSWLTSYSANLRHAATGNSEIHPRK